MRRNDLAQCKELDGTVYYAEVQRPSFCGIPESISGNGSQLSAKESQRLHTEEEGKSFLLTLWGDRTYWHLGKIGSDQPITKWEQQALTRQWGFLYFWVLTVSQLGCKCGDMSDRLIFCDFVYLRVTNFLLFKNVFCWFTAGQCFLPILH